MDAASRRSRAIRKLTPTERVAVFARSIRGADPGERAAMAGELIELAAFDAAAITAVRRRKLLSEHAGAQAAAAKALAEHWAEIPKALRPLALSACRGRWKAVAGGVEVGAVSAASLAEIALDSGDPAWIDALLGMLRLEESSANSAAAQALLGMAIRVAPEAPEPALLGVDPRAPAMRPVLDGAAEPWAQEDLRALHRAVVAALESFDSHRRKEILLAAVLLIERPPGAGRAESGVLLVAARAAQGGASEALRTAFRRARAPIARSRAWHWLREERLAASCMERLARAPSLLDHAVVLREGHLALAPARRRHLGLIQIATRPAPVDTVPAGAAPGGRRLHPEGPLPGREALAQLDVVARRQVPRLARSLAHDAGTLSLALDPLLIDPDPLVRLAALLGLPGRDEARDFCFDGSEAVARVAATRASSCGNAESERLREGDGARRRFAVALARSPHAHVRRIGVEETARLSPGAASPAERLAARRRRGADVSGFVDWIRDTVRSGDGQSGVSALMTCRRIGAARDVEPLLLALVRDSLASGENDARLTATAIACLGDIASARSVGVLVECLARHPDARARANAADALGRARREHSRDGVLESSADDAHHRVKGSVLRSLVSPWTEVKPSGAGADAVGMLSKMLLDERAPHRVAAVWVVQRSLTVALQGGLGRRWRDVESIVRWAAEGDADTRVRARAALVVGRLDAATEGLGPKRPAGASA